MSIDLHRLLELAGRSPVRKLMERTEVVPFRTFKGDEIKLRLYWNPSPAQAKRLVDVSKNHTMRAVLVGQDLVAFNAYDVDHGDVLELLGHPRMGTGRKGKLFLIHDDRGYRFGDNFRNHAAAYLCSPNIQRLIAGGFSALGADDVAQDDTIPIETDEPKRMAWSESVGSEPAWVTEIFALDDGERRDFRIQGAELSVAALGINLPDDERPIGLRGLEVPEGARGSGVGSTIYRALVAGSARYGRPLELDAYPYEERAANGGRAPEAKVRALVSYLERFGFRTLRQNPSFNSPVAMVYRPS